MMGRHIDHFDDCRRLWLNELQIITFLDSGKMEHFFINTRVHIYTGCLQFYAVCFFLEYGLKIFFGCLLSGAKSGRELVNFWRQKKGRQRGKRAAVF